MLGLLVLAIILITAYGIITSDITPEERDEMLNDKEMWP